MIWKWDIPQYTLIWSLGRGHFGKLNEATGIGSGHCGVDVKWGYTHSWTAYSMENPINMGTPWYPLFVGNHHFVNQPFLRGQKDLLTHVCHFIDCINHAWSMNDIWLQSKLRSNKRYLNPKVSKSKEILLSKLALEKWSLRHLPTLGFWVQHVL